MKLRGSHLVIHSILCTSNFSFTLHSLKTVLLTTFVHLMTSQNFRQQAAVLGATNSHKTHHKFRDMQMRYFSLFKQHINLKSLPKNLKTIAQVSRRQAKWIGNYSVEVRNGDGSDPSAPRSRVKTYREVENSTRASFIHIFTALNAREITWCSASNIYGSEAPATEQSSAENTMHEMQNNVTAKTQKHSK